MPEEIFALLIISILSLTVLSILAMSLRYKSRKAERSITRGSSSLTTSELERMIKRAVKLATSPMEEQLERLEEAIISGRARRELDVRRTDLLADMDLHQTEDKETQIQRRAGVRS